MRISGPRTAMAIGFALALALVSGLMFGLCRQLGGDCRVAWGSEVPRMARAQR